MRKITATTLVGLTLLFSCKFDSQNYMEPINGKINITLREALGSDTSSFFFYFETVTNYECSNYNILLDANVVDNSVAITFNQIYKDFTCTQSVGPAFNSYVFSQIPSDTINVSFKIKDGQAVSGTLIGTDNAYALNIGQSPDINFVNTNIFKMPTGIFWGSYLKANENPPALAAVDSLLAIFADEGLADTLLTPGDYSYFIIDQDNNVIPRKKSIPTGTKSFVYYLNPDSVSQADLYLKINAFRNTYSADIAVEAFDWQGNAY